MGMTVTGENLEDIRCKVGYRNPTPAISINWLDSDYGHKPERGCIVNDRRARVPVQFNDAASAIRYVTKIIKDHEAWVKAEIAKRNKEVAAMAKKK